MRIKLLKKYQYVYDLETNTLDGQPVKSSDLLMMLDHYRYKHPDDEHIAKVLALWAYGRDKPIDTSFTTATK